MSESPAAAELATPPAAVRSQFTLRQLFTAMTLIALCLSIYGWLGPNFFGISVTLVLILGIGCAYWSHTYERMVISLFVMLMALLALPAVIPNCSDCNPVGACQFRLKMLHMALAMYHQQHGSYPPLVITSATGEPLHSWRTLLLPTVERSDLADRYDMGEPWDSPRNSQLHGSQVDAFTCPSDPLRRKGTQGCASYFAITDSARPGKMFAVIDIPGTGISLFEPRDFSITELQAMRSLQGHRNTGFLGGNVVDVNVLWPDGNIERISVKELLPALKRKLQAPNRSAQSPQPATSAAK